MSKIINEYKQFALKGNVLDMAVGIVVGGAFATIASSLVEHIIAPILGVLTSGVDLANLFVVLKSGVRGEPYLTLQEANLDGAVTISYGLFLNGVFSFLIVTWFAFLMVKAINHMRQNEAQSEAKSLKECHYCFSQIDQRASKCASCASVLEP
ncbi:MAG: large conductance mechanosensitive channel protein MscL [Oleiphilus sp.]|nr:MAG: large conductance mechanosensitive channel protein MscL [Oleiphilus sp.]